MLKFYLTSWWFFFQALYLRMYSTIECIRFGKGIRFTSATRILSGNPVWGYFMILLKKDVNEKTLLFIAKSVTTWQYTLISLTYGLIYFARNDGKGQNQNFFTTIKPASQNTSIRPFLSFLSIMYGLNFYWNGRIISAGFFSVKLFWFQSAST